VNARSFDAKAEAASNSLALEALLAVEVDGSTVDGLGNSLRGPYRYLAPAADDTWLRRAAREGSLVAGGNACIVVSLRVDGRSKAMAKVTLEQRVSRIEKELSQLKAAVSSEQGAPWWRQIVGDFKGDKAFAEIVQMGRQIRQAQ